MASDTRPSDRIRGEDGCGWQPPSAGSRAASRHGITPFPIVRAAADPGRALRLRRGAATILVVVAVIITLTVLGYAGLRIANKDSLLAGSMIDIKSRENAAQAGLRLALGRMENRPRNTVRQLQFFIDDSTAGSPRQWMVFEGDSFRMVAADPGFQALGSDGSGHRVRVLGIDAGGAFGAVNGVTLALESTGEGRNGDRQTIVGTYRMRGVDVPAIAAVPSSGDTYALYINGSMGNSTIATNVNGDVYVGGNNHLNASVSITINGNLRTQGNYKTSAPVTVTKNGYIGGYIENAAHGEMIFNGSLGVGDGFGNVNSDILVGGSMNVYGKRLDSWNSGAHLSVGGQFLYRDTVFMGGGPLTIGGNAYFPRGVRFPNETNLIRGRLEVGGSQPSTVAGTLDVHGEAAFRGTGRVTFSGNTKTFHSNFASSPDVYQNTGLIDINGNALFQGGISNINGTPGIDVLGDMYLSHPAQLPFSGYVLLRKTLSMNGGIAANFGSTSGSLQKWRFDLSSVPRTWSYQNATEGTNNPIVADAGTAASGPTPGGPWRQNVAAVFPSVVASYQDPKGLVLPAGNNLGYRVRDTCVSLIENPPDTVILSTAINDATHDFSAIKAAAGVDNALTGASLNTLYAYYTSQGWLHNGYMILRIDEAVSMTSASPAFIGKSLIIFDAQLTTNMSWPASADSTRIQVLYVRNGDLGNNFGSPGPFWGYIHYERQWSGNHKWPTGSQMFGSIYLAGPASSVIGNGSNLSLDRRQSVFTDIAANLSILYANGTTGGGGASSSSKTLVLRETWVQFDRISELR